MLYSLSSRDIGGGYFEGRGVKKNAAEGDCNISVPLFFIEAGTLCVDIESVRAFSILSFPQAFLTRPTGSPAALRSSVVS